jgi:hypothetical protein
MHLINLKYSTYFNHKYAHCGHTFQSRFRATLVQAKEYAREVVPYIHLNPVRAGIVSRPEEYEWSNYREYLGSIAPAPWTDNAFVLMLFGASLSEARKEYEKCVLDRLSRNPPSPFASTKETGILGRPEFIDQISRPILATQAPQEIHDRTRSHRPQPRPDFRRIQLETEDVLGPKSRLVRNIAIYISHTATDHTLKAIGEFFGMGGSGIADICRRMKKELVHNETLARSVQDITRRLLS